MGGRMKAVLIGYGEIGKGVFDVFSMYHDITPHDPDQNKTAVGKYDIMLVTIPPIKGFVQVIKDYQKQYGVKSTIVFGTTPIGTCSQIDAVHCPVEGRHPNLAESIRITDKWLGGKDKLAHRFITEAEFTIHQLDRPEFTEFLKLRSTTVYGLNIEFARYSKDVCDSLGLNFEETKEWDKWVNRIYSHFGMDWARRYILDAPEGPKGGHCVTPNAKILNKQFPNKMVKIVGE
jgi:hypothetical protein